MSIDWHSAPLASDTPIDHSFRKTQNVRRFFVTLCGAEFRFDHDMIRFVDEDDPQTLGDIASYWQARGGKRALNG